MELVIIDGLDGCGKSTQAHLMMQSLKSMRKTACLRVHPETDNWFGLRAHVYLYSKRARAPRGFDNITVPFLSVLLFLLLMGVT